MLICKSLKGAIVQFQRAFGLLILWIGKYIYVLLLVLAVVFTFAIEPVDQALPRLQFNVQLVKPTSLNLWLEQVLASFPENSAH